MRSSKQNPSGEDVSPGEIAAVEAALRHLDSQHKNKRVLGQIAQWFLVLKMYKALEVNFAKSKDRRANESKHRALLTAIMGVGEALLNQSQHLPDSEFLLICSSRESLAANVRYLREKYEQWFVEIDAQEMQRVWTKLTDEREVDMRDPLQA